MALVNTSRNNLTMFDSLMVFTSGESSQGRLPGSIALNSTAGSTAPTLFPLKRDCKTVFIVQFGGPSSGAKNHFLVSHGDEGLAWQRSTNWERHEYAATYASSGFYGYVATLGPYESAKFICKADSTDNDIDSTGDPAIKIGYVQTSTATASTAITAGDSFKSTASSGWVTASAYVTTINLPTVEYST